MFIHRNFLAILALLTVISACSHGPAPPKRGKLAGKVTVNGKPVANGSVCFMAIDPNGMNVRAAIKDGQFSLPETEGPTKGKYRVELYVPSATKRRIPNDDSPGQFIEEAPETLPPRYNRESTLTAEFDPAAPQSYEFNVTVP